MNRAALPNILEDLGIDIAEVEAATHRLGSSGGNFSPPPGGFDSLPGGPELFKRRLERQAPASQGHRNNAVVRAAFEAGDCGCGPVDGAPIVLAYAATFTPRLSDAEVVQTFTGVFNSERQTPFGWRLKAAKKKRREVAKFVYDDELVFDERLKVDVPVATVSVGSRVRCRGERWQVRPPQPSYGYEYPALVDPTRTHAAMPIVPTASFAEQVETEARCALGAPHGTFPINTKKSTLSSKSAGPEVLRGATVFGVENVDVVVVPPGGYASEAIDVVMSQHPNGAGIVLATPTGSGKSHATGEIARDQHGVGIVVPERVVALDIARRLNLYAYSDREGHSFKGHKWVVRGVKTDLVVSTVCSASQLEGPFDVFAMDEFPAASTQLHASALFPNGGSATLATLQHFLTAAKFPTLASADFDEHWFRLGADLIRESRRDDPLVLVVQAPPDRGEVRLVGQSQFECELFERLDSLPESGTRLFAALTGRWHPFEYAEVAPGGASVFALSGLNSSEKEMQDALHHLDAVVREHDATMVSPCVARGVDIQATVDATYLQWMPGGPTISQTVQAGARVRCNAPVTANVKHMRAGVSLDLASIQRDEATKAARTIRGVLEAAGLADFESHTLDPLLHADSVYARIGVLKELEARRARANSVAYFAHKVALGGWRAVEDFAAPAKAVRDGVAARLKAARQAVRGVRVSETVSAQRLGRFSPGLIRNRRVLCKADARALERSTIETKYLAPHEVPEPPDEAQLRSLRPASTFGPFDGQDTGGDDFSSLVWLDDFGCHRKKIAAAVMVELVLQGEDAAVAWRDAERLRGDDFQPADLQHDLSRAKLRAELIRVFFGSPSSLADLHGSSFDRATLEGKLLAMGAHLTQEKLEEINRTLGMTITWASVGAPTKLVNGVLRSLGLNLRVKKSASGRTYTVDTAAVTAFWEQLLRQERRRARYGALQGGARAYVARLKAGRS